MPNTVDFQLHRIQENGFIFALVQGEEGNSTRTLFLLRLFESNPRAPSLQLALHELTADGSLGSSITTVALKEHFRRFMKDMLLTEYQNWKSSCPFGPGTIPTSDTVH